MYVVCRSVCDQDQNEIKRSKPFWELIKVASELWNSIHQGRVTAIWPIKSFRRERLSNQDFFADQTPWSQLQTLQQATCKWPPLDITSYPSFSQEKQEAMTDTLSNLSHKMTVQLYSCYLSMMKDQLNSTVSMHQCSSLIPRPRPAFHHLQFRKPVEPGNEATSAVLLLIVALIYHCMSCIHTLNTQAHTHTHTHWYHIAHVLTHTAQWW